MPVSHATLDLLVSQDNPEGYAVPERLLASKSLILDDDSCVTNLLENLVLLDGEGNTPIVQELTLVLLGNLMSDTGETPTEDGEGLEEMRREALLEAARGDLGNAGETVLGADASLARVDDADRAPLEANSGGLGTIVRKTHGDDRLLA